MTITLPPHLPLAQRPTPLQFMPRASARYGAGKRLWIKRDDLTGSVLSGNKVRKLEFVVAMARAEGCNALITCGGVQSNHCRSTALVGAALGMPVTLLLRGERPAELDGNLLLDALAGATVHYYDNAEFVARQDELLVQHQRACAERGERAWIIPIGASDGHGLWGYIAACAELQQDFADAGIERAHIVTATGSGGTQAGLTQGVALYEIDATVWGVAVCDDEAYFIDKVRADIDDWRRLYPRDNVPAVTPRVIDGYVGPGYGRAGPEVFATIAELARLEGIVLDPVYTGKAFHGLVQELQSGRFEACDDIVFVHTGGVFGLFPQREQLNALQS